MAEGHKPKMMLLQVEKMDHDLREYVRAENCSMSTQMKLAPLYVILTGKDGKAHHGTFTALVFQQKERPT